ncbi:MAG: hypothetical protein KAS32_10180 [Candidatus Peribacteraceae bacterium]|nr:hypothetical protein [Candidatus Peribacteraceae bacterium]
MDLLEVNDQYGTFIWAMALRYHTGAWGAEDVAQSLLIQLTTAINDKNLGTDMGAVKSFIITKAIDIVRYEVRRQQCRKGGRPEASTQSVEETEMEERLIKELLYKRLPQNIADFIFELAFPSPDTVEIAQQEQEKHLADDSGELHMCMHELKITSRHVALHFKKQGVNISRPTISKYRSEARSVLVDIFGQWTAKDETESDIVESILEGILT